MSTAKIFISEGTSDFATLKALGRRIGELGATRQKFSLLHDLGHHILADPGANEPGMPGVFVNLLILTEAENDHLADLPTAFSAGALQSGRAFPPLPVERPSASSLPAWNTRVFAGIAADRWFGDDPQIAGQDLAVRDHAASQPVTVRVVFHILAGAGALLVDSWAAMVRTIDSMLAAMFLMRLLVRVGIRRLAGASSFVLIIIAACRHYGRRSEPADHTSLLIRRDLVSMGSCLLV